MNQTQELFQALAAQPARAESAKAMVDKETQALFSHITVYPDKERARIAKLLLLMANESDGSMAISTGAERNAFRSLVNTLKANYEALDAPEKSQAMIARVVEEAGQ